VTSCTDQLFEPEKQIEVIFVFAHANFKKGLRTMHLKAVGKALEAVFQLILQGEEWNAKAVQAWSWFWSIVSSTMHLELEALETGLCDEVLINWEKVKTTTDVESLGQKFWVQLNDEAPEQTKIFRRPLKMWGTLLHHIMDMLIVSIKEPDIFFDELLALTIRHVRYGVRPEYLQPFGNALFSTLEDLLGDQWTERTQKAWRMVWKRATNSIARGLNVGGNALTYALVDGDVRALKEAVAPAARSLRALLLCRMEIEGAVLSPLMWALKDGKVDIAEFILQDLLTIRADLHGYYYGRSELFQHHRNLVEEIGREAPGLFKVLLNGLVWHSRKKVAGGLVVVNYYIKDIYGDPGDHADPWLSPLAHIIMTAHNDIIKHPVVTKVIDMKLRNSESKKKNIKRSPLT
jgi:hemoglobin-like flavoprotein